MSEAPHEAQAAPGDDAELNALAMLVALLILAAALVGGRMVQRAQVKWIGEAGVGLLIGLAIGLILYWAKVAPALGSRISFKASVFLLVFMPTIMFHAGFTLDTAPFLMNIGSICMTAFIGTTISTFVIGFMMWGFGQWGWCYSMPLLYNLTFGAIISATDPVAVLAVFENLNANKQLYINVFGESVLNDAVAMVLYNTISRFLEVPVTTGEVFKGIGIFIGIFVGSVLVGLVLAFVAALLFKTGYFHAALGSAPKPSESATHWAPQINGTGDLSAKSKELLEPQVKPDGEGSHEEHGDEQAAIYETAFVLTVAYISYMAATASFLSGITAIISAGMVMNAYLKPNLSDDSNLRVSVVSKTLAITFELFSFVYIGLSVLQSQDWGVVRYTILCLFALAISRAANIYPMCAIVNFLRPPERRISRNEQFMMWWSGLRGPMAFALALDASEKYGKNGTLMKTCTLYLIVITVLFNGGLAAHFMSYLKLRADDVQEPHPAAQPPAGDKEATWLLAPGQRPPAGTYDTEQGTGARLPVITESSHSGQELVSAASGGLLPWSGRAVDITLGNEKPHPLAAASSEGLSGLSPAASGGVPSRILANIRQFNSGRLTEKLSNVDRVVSKILVGNLERSPSTASMQPSPRTVERPASPTGRSSQNGGLAGVSPGASPPPGRVSNNGGGLPRANDIAPHVTH